MSGNDRVGVAGHVVSQEDKLSRTLCVPAHASGQNVSQVWRAGPLRVRLEERAGVIGLVVEVRWVALLGWARALGCEWSLGARCVGTTGQLRVRVPLTPALDRFLVELVDLIADVRLASGTVQLELEGLEEGDGGDVASGGVERSGVGGTDRKRGREEGAVEVGRPAVGQC